MNGSVNTVLGPIPADQLGVVSVHETLLSVFPGAQFAFDIVIDRAEIFDTLAAKLNDFKAAGGGTIVDSSGQFHGRDLKLYESLARATGVHIVASTGQGPEAMLGGYFLTPQTNPPTPWPAEKFAELFGKEVGEGMVVPRVERRASAGLVATATTRQGRTATDESLVRGAARAALEGGVPLSLRYGADALGDLELATSEGLPAERIVIAGLDRADAAGLALRVGSAGAYIGIDSAGTNDDVTDRDRVVLVAELIEAGHAGRVLLSSSATGVAKGHEAREVPFDHILSNFVPALREHGVDEASIQRILVENPRDLLTVR